MPWHQPSKDSMMALSEVDWGYTSMWQSLKENDDIDDQLVALILGRAPFNVYNPTISPAKSLWFRLSDHGFTLAHEFVNWIHSRLGMFVASQKRIPKRKPKWVAVPWILNNVNEHGKKYWHTTWPCEKVTTCLAAAIISKFGCKQISKQTLCVATPKR